MNGYEYLTTHCHLLHSFGGNPDAMLKHFGRASGGERVLIAAALSLLHPLDRPEGAEKVLIQLYNVGSLDHQNTRILLRAIEIEAGHEGLVV